MKQTLLDVEQLQIAYGTRVVVPRVSFSLAPGEILCIAGQSGSGKSTLLKALMGTDPALGVQGRILWEGQDLTQMKPRQRQRLLGTSIALVPQDPAASFNPVRSYGAQIRELLISHGRYCRKTFYEEIGELFSKLALEDWQRILKSRPYELSGGMNQRVALAAAMLLKPRLLLADEPTSALDTTLQKQMAQELLRLRELFGVSQIVVTHNLALAGFLADKTGIMHNGQLIECNETQTLLHTPIHEPTRRLIASVPSLGSGKPEPPSSRPLLVCSGLCKAFSRQTHKVEALQDVTFTINGRETLGIVGESGSGKSTLVRVVAGLVTPDQGSVQLEGKVLGKRRNPSQLQAIQMVFQDPRASFDPRMTMGASIQETMRCLLGHGNLEEVEQLTQLVGLAPSLCRRYPFQLSGGQCQRFAIARALSVKPALLLCDEITSALDVSAQANILDLLNQLQETLHMSILFVSHDLAVVSQLCHRGLVLHHGSLVESGPCGQVISGPRDAYTKELLSSVLELPR